MKINGVKVRDAHKPVVLHITNRDAVGGQKDPGNCAAAKAALRIEGVKEARVYRSRTYLKVEKTTGKEEWIRFTTPDSVRTEMVSFDRGAIFDPGDYVLTPPPPSRQLGAMARGPNPSKRRSGKGHRPSHILKGARERASYEREK